MTERIHSLLKEAGLRITPQRTAVLEVVLNLKIHGTMDDVIGLVQQTNAHISAGTIYRIVDLLYEKGIIGKIKTRSGSMRLDSKREHHHHLVNRDESRIEDYYDPELDRLLHEYFRNKGVKDFSIEQISVELLGRFNDKRD